MGALVSRTSGGENVRFTGYSLPNLRNLKINKALETAKVLDFESLARWTFEWVGWFSCRL